MEKMGCVPGFYADDIRNVAKSVRKKNVVRKPSVKYGIL
jgi:hypothetical protein